MNLLIIAGHGETDPGAGGNGYWESTLTRELVTLINEEAKKHSALTACLYPFNKDCYQQLKRGIKFDFTPYDYVLEIHFNAESTGKAHGTLLIVHDSEPGITVEQLILKKLEEAGTTQSWNGVVRSPSEWGSSLLVNSTCRKQGVSHALLETCFITSATDMQWYQANKKVIAMQIVNAIIEGFGLSSATTNPNTGIKYTVQVGAFSQKDNADKLVSELKSKGYDAFVKGV